MDNLPNLHPAVVHFPIALFSIVVLLEGMRLFFNRNWINIATLFLSGLSAAGAIAAYLTGRTAADGFELTSDQIPAVVMHSDLALETSIFISVFFLFRIILYYLKKDNRKILKLFIFIISLIPMFWIIKTADAGGALVYKFNIGRTVKVESMEILPDIVRRSAEKSVSKQFTGFNDNGLWTWSGSEDVQTYFFSSFDLSGNIHGELVQEEKPSGTSYLKLTTGSESESKASFRETAQNVMIEVKIDLSKFSGEFSLFHNFLKGDSSADLLRIRNGRISFVRLVGEKEKNFGSKDINVKEKFNMKLSAYEKHFQAYINGKLILHGHDEPLKGSRVGFIINGKGEIKIYNFKIQKLKKN